ncbi:MAG: histidine kinase dimerization/phospho-acceptor domain-containing protein, partial [Arcobacteraceae bacterium]|nr:histidine kinase dimerization/phospho-acceptor domain-containing protein [Arcobacteraceae bacterium]
MIYSKSIYKQFHQKLIFATSIFIVTLSFIFYGYTKATIYEDIKDGLLQDAKLIYKVSKESKFQDATFNVITLGDVNVDIVALEDVNDIKYINFRQNDDYYVQLLYPFDIQEKKFIKITKNINSSRKMLSKIFNNILLLSLGGLIMVILYAFTVSKTLLKPIIQITEKLSNMNENFLTQIDKNTLPIEFHPLANSINTLTNKIQNFVKFKKELFIGAAHELKTPLAVMKLKNEVTLMKKRECTKYEETLKLTIAQINEMNKMITSILDIGRAEGAQFEKPVELDIVNFLNSK